MKEYQKSTIFVAGAILVFVVLTVIGGWHYRGYFAFDAGLIILILSPFIIRAYYIQEKREYRYRKTVMRRMER